MSIARHPIDVLVSMLHFSAHEPDVARWLHGDYLAGLAGSSPTSARFSAFALGSGAQHLLSVTPQWWGDPATVRTTYEALVDRPERALEFLGSVLGAAPVVPYDQAVAKLTLRHYRRLPNGHIFQARPGLWRELVLPNLAVRIRAVHPGSFTPLGYRCDPDQSLSATQAARAWDRVRR
jgi:hypothetical protein